MRLLTNWEKQKEAKVGLALQENNPIKLLTPRDIQSIFKIGKNQAYALMHSAGFPTIMLNNRMYVEERSLKDWIEKYKGRRYLFSYE